MIKIKEVYLQCKHCLASETVTLVDGKLENHSRFIQIEGKIYHLCGECKVIGDKK